jgi:hypothetical protein
MNISLPKTLADCTPEQLSKWVFLSGDGINLETLSQSLDFQVQVIAIFSNVSKPKLYDSDAVDVRRAFNHLIHILSERTELVGHVTIKGQKYVFDKEFEKKTTGLIIDIKIIESVYDAPYKVLAMLYIEEGLKYNQLDDDDNIINPTSKRIEAFKEEFPGDEFLNVFAFFLDRWEQLKDAMYILNMATTKSMMTTTKNELKKDLQTLTGTIGHRTSSDLPKVNTIYMAVNEAQILQELQRGGLGVNPTEVYSNFITDIGNDIMKQFRTVIEKETKSTNGALKSSVVVVPSKNGFEIEADYYYKFIDDGVSGVGGGMNPIRSIVTNGTYKFKNLGVPEAMAKSIREWSGASIEQSYAIGVNIKRYGIKPKNITGCHRCGS